MPVNRAYISSPFLYSLSDIRSTGVSEFELLLLDSSLFDTFLAPAVNRLQIRNMYLLCHKNRVYDKMNMIQALKVGKYGSITDVYYLSTLQGNTIHHWTIRFGIHSRMICGVIIKLLQKVFQYCFTDFLVFFCGKNI